MSGVRPCPRRDSGFTLLELTIVGLLMMLGAVWLANRTQNDLEDDAARITAAVFLTVRGAVQATLVRHFDALAGYPPAAVPRPAPPDYLQGPPPWDFAAHQLQRTDPDGATATLPAAVVVTPPLGGDVRVRIDRVGSCPGTDCRLQAFVYGSGPLRQTDAAEYSAAMVGAFMLASQGYGGHAPPDNADRLRGALFDVANPLGAVTGVVAVAADLEATTFHQFVRQGDRREVWLQNALHVEGEIDTATGLRWHTAVTPGDGCTPDGRYARTSRNTLGVCLTGIWFELDRYVVQGRQGGLADGDAVPQPSCPGGTQPFMELALEDVDVALRGADIDVRGQVSGGLSGSGSADPSGAVTISGSFSGDLASTPDSRIDVVQAVQLDGGRVQLTGAGPAARAYAVYGCIQGSGG